MTDHHIHPDPAVRALVERTKAEADDERAAKKIAADAADRFRDVLSECLGHEDENPGDDVLVTELREHFGRTGPESTRWREFCSGALAVVDQLNAERADSLAAQPAPEARTVEYVAHRWDDDPNHPEGFDCDGYPLSSGERCGQVHTPTAPRRRPEEAMTDKPIPLDPIDPTVIAPGVAAIPLTPTPWDDAEDGQHAVTPDGTVWQRRKGLWHMDPWWQHEDAEQIIAVCAEPDDWAYGLGWTRKQVEEARGPLTYITLPEEPS